MQDYRGLSQDLLASLYQSAMCIRKGGMVAHAHNYTLTDRRCACITLRTSPDAACQSRCRSAGGPRGSTIRTTSNLVSKMRAIRGKLFTYVHVDSNILL